LAETGQKSIEWIAGLFEGEGCLTYNTTNDSWCLKVKMTDTDVMWGLYLALGCRGNLAGLVKHPSDAEQNKPHQTWSTSKRDLIFELVTELYPHMYSRRREKMVEFMNWYQEKQK
jgi:hypothetical protein